ncbi:MAG: YegP family protein [Oxalobacter sp.]|nr:YegP family protein [Oxalobacter sp.]
MGKYVIKEAKTGSKFNLVAGNGEVIASSQVYKSASGLKNGIASVQKNAPNAAIENQTVEGYATEKHPKFEVYTDKAGEYRFRLKASNGQIIAVSEGYKALKSCLNGVASVKKNAASDKITQEAKK